MGVGIFTTSVLRHAALRTSIQLHPSSAGEIPLCCCRSIPIPPRKLQEALQGAGRLTIHDEGATQRALYGRPEGTHQYRVAACNEAGCSDWSGTMQVQVQMPPPVPFGLWVWYERISGLKTRYSAFWGDDGTSLGFELDGPATCMTSGMSCVMEVNKMSSSAPFRVRACNAAGCSAWSDPFVAEPMP